MRKSIKNVNFKNLIEKKKAKQVSALYVSMVFGILIGIGVSVVNTRLLGPQQYGNLKFLQNLFAFIVTFLTLGVFVSGSKTLAQRKNENIKLQLIGTLFILATAISIVLIIVLFIFSFFEEQLFQNELGRIIRIFYPLLFVFPFQLCLEYIMQGDNKIYELSIFRVGPRILYILVAISFNYFVSLSLTSALAIQFLTFALIILIMIISLKPKFNNLKKNIFIIWQQNKTYGFQVYIGVLAGVASTRLGGLSIGYFIDNTNVGFFSLAITAAMPLTMIPNVVGTTFFKDFADRNDIPKNILALTTFFSLCTFVLFVLLIKPVFFLLYPAEFKPVIPIIYLISIAHIFRGFGFFFNRFLGAHGKGKELRNAAFAVGISNVLGFMVLVYLFGVKGAAVTMIISYLIYFRMMFFSYKKCTNELLHRS